MTGDRRRREERSSLARRLRIVWDLYRPVRALFFLFLIAVGFAMLAESLALAAIAPLLSGVGDSGVQGIYGDMMKLIGLDPTSEVQLVVLVGVLFVVRSIAQYGSNLVSGVMVRREAVRLQTDLFSLYLGLDWERALALSQGEANLLLTAQTNQAAQFLRRLVKLVEGLIYVVGLTVVAMLVSPENTLLAVGLIGLSALAVSFIATRVSRIADRILARSKAQAGVLLQYARGSQMLRAFAVSDAAVADVERLAKEREALAFRSQRVQALAQVIPDLLFVLALLAVVALAFQRGDGLAEVGAIVALLFRVSQYLKRLSEASQLSAMLPAVKDVHRAQVMFSANQAALLSSTDDPDFTPGAIELNAVRYAYRGAERQAVKPTTALVRPGEFVGIVGSSGSGKSTLVSLMVGLLSPTAGSVRVGVKLTDVRELAYVAQTPFILSGTVASNVRWFRPISDLEVERACEAAGLQAVIDRMPDGIHSVIGQEGLTLSGGERQRMSLARALAGKPRILILDEATSALDSESESAIRSSLEAMHGEVTVVAVAHRLSTVLEADRIWVMEDGEIIEDAPPTELLRNRSRFAQLSAMQGIEAQD